MQNQKVEFFNLFKYFIFFFYFSAIYQIMYYASGVSGSVGLRESFYLTFLWLIPILIFQKYSKKIALFIGLLLWAGSLANLGYFAIYKQEFSQSVIFIMFESNITEGTEFLKTYFVWWIVPLYLVYSLIAYVLWKRLTTVDIHLKSKFLIIPFSLLIATHTFAKMYFVEEAPVDLAVKKQINNMTSATPWNLVLGYVSYKEDLASMENLLEQNSKLEPLANLVDKNKDETSTMILVIGESTNRNRMSLYGYERDTTPRLKALENELIAFDNVYSPRPYTIEVLQQALTFADEQNPDLYLTKPNLINIMKQAGYETYWITNQQTQTTRNTMLTTFSKMCDHQKYLNNNRRQNSSSYDEIVLEPFKEVLNDNSIKKKFIVVHLLGTHIKYDYRYPESYAKFDNAQVSDKLTDEEAKLYNSYDNAVYYNDYVISELIKLVSKESSKASLLYLSDHGEEVFDDKNIKKLGRNEMAPTKAMYTVPFIIYGNEKWKDSVDFNKLSTYKNRMYTSANLIYTYSDLAGINFDEMDKTKSIINDEFLETPVIIGDPYKNNKLRDLLKKPFES